MQHGSLSVCTSVCCTTQVLHGMGEAPRRAHTGTLCGRFALLRSIPKPAQCPAHVSPLGGATACLMPGLPTALGVLCSTGNPPVRTRANPHAEYSRAAMGAVWRVSFALLIPLVLYVM